MRNLAERIAHHWQGNEKSRFLLIGAVNTGFGYASFTVYYILLERWLNYLLVAVLAHMTAVCFAFYLHRRIVFRSESPWWPEFVRYNLSLLGVLLAGLAGLAILVSGIGLHPLLGQAIVTLFSVVISYMAHRHFSFKKR